MHSMIFNRRSTMADNAGGTNGEGTGAAAGGAAGEGAGAGNGVDGAASAPWHGAADPDAVAYVTAKGWKAPADVIKSYQNAEKLIGRDPNSLLVMPKEGDEAGFNDFYTKLGRPADAKGYDMKVNSDGLSLDPGYSEWAAGTFHKLGLSKKQGEALLASHNDYMRSTLAAQAKDYDLNVQADRTALQTEWRGGFERMMGAAQGAVRALDIPAEAIDGIERALGYAGTMKLFATIGGKLGEDKFVSADGKSAGFGNSMTPDEARQQLAQMKLDPATRSALTDAQHPAHKDTKAKWQKLHGVAFPEV
jgi:hypothetical protein